MDAACHLELFSVISSTSFGSKLESNFGVTVHHTTTDGSQTPTVVIPPGWFVMTCVVEENEVLGVLVSQLTKSSATRHMIAMCVGNELDGKVAKPWLDLLDVQTRS